MPIMTLDQLPLSNAEREAAEAEIRQEAYLKWEQAGRPDGDGLRFWQQAELEWIEYRYVPNRHNGLDDIDEDVRVPLLTA